ncbi:MAG: DUF72 domain-containing protein [Gammaproteobacteria bacterium]|nr:MAG: DUF72 domain-containing protein [Gammaproteobacteria bacterium]
MSGAPASAPRVRVGPCGFPEARARLFRDFSILEVQASFYRPVPPATAARWRAEAPPGFLFTLKAWQLLTHEPSSPTYRRLGRPLSAAERRLAGGLRWNPVTRRAWAATLETARALGAAAVLLQLPASFDPRPAHLRRLRRFCEGAERGGMRLAVELRGPAWEDRLLRRLARELAFTPVVDPFLRPPPAPGLRYFRLHGLPAYRYAYRYTDEDLARLRGLLRGPWPHWVLFNNVAMAEDARRFLRLLASPGAAPQGEG